MERKSENHVSATRGVYGGYDAKLRRVTDTLRHSMDAAGYKHAVLGLVFLKYISEVFEEHRARIQCVPYADPEDPNEYRAVNVFWVPPEARWSRLRESARQPTIGQIVDEAMEAVERDNPSLKGVLHKDYASSAMDKQWLGQLINIVTDIRVGSDRTEDMLGRVYEHIKARSGEGRSGGEFYTPRCVVRLLVEMLEPFQGRVYDPCCGSAGMFVQSAEFIEAHATSNANGGCLPVRCTQTGARAQISIYGQELNYTTWRLAKMNLAIRGIDGKIEHGDTLLSDRFPDLKADFILANPPFNMKGWGGERLRNDKRWKFGVPPVCNANFAWMQHIIHHLAPTGYAGVVMANGSMFSNQSGEGEIRKNIIEADLVDCMVALPDKLFYSTQIPVCVWFIAMDKSGKPSPSGKWVVCEGYRDRRGDVLFIDARKLGSMVSRTPRELTDEEIQRIVRTYHSWRGEKDAGEYQDIPGFCKSATLEEIRKHGYVLTPSSYVGAEVQDEDDEPFEEKTQRLVARLLEHQAEVCRLVEVIWKNLKE